MARGYGVEFAALLPDAEFAIRRMRGRGEGEPENLFERQAEPVPGATSRQVTFSRQVRADLREAYGIFLVAFKRAWERLRNGELDASFPEGTFPPALPFRIAPAT